MQYLRVVASASTRGMIYQRDFTVQEVFRTFVRSFVSKLIEDRLVQEHSRFTAKIIPGYGVYKPLPLVHAAGLEVPERIHVEKLPWIVLKFEDGVHPDTPLTYFTVEIFIDQGPKYFRQSFTFVEQATFFYDIETYLRKKKVLRYKEQCEMVLFARDDEEVNFKHEEINMPPAEDTSLVELVQVKPHPLVLPRRTLEDFQIEQTLYLVRGKLVPTVFRDTARQAPGIHVLITRAALKNLQKQAGSDLRVEQGGMLIGLIYENPDLSQHLVVITNDIPAEDLQASSVEFHYTYRSWKRQNALRKELYSEKRIVGWYHTHVITRMVYYPEVPEESYSSGLFFSETDFFTHRQFFKEKWYVGMVLDPAGNLIVFRWEGDEIKPVSQFLIVSTEKA